MSRRRKPTRPTTCSPAATAASAIVGSNEKGSIGIRGTWVNGAKFINHGGSPKTPPNSPTTRKKAGAPQPIAAVHRCMLCAALEVRLEGGGLQCKLQAERCHRGGRNGHDELGWVGRECA